MKNTKEIFGKIKNIILWFSILISIYILFSEFLNIGFLKSLVIKILALLHIYIFLKVNTSKFLRGF